MQDYDLLDVVLLCQAALAQDSPEPPDFYINQILNRCFAYLTSEQKQEVEVYLAEKKYLPPVDLILWPITHSDIKTKIVVITK